MKQTWLQHIYNRSPSFAQTMMVNIYASKIHKERYGRNFKKVLDELLHTQYYTEEEINEYQNERLRRIVSHAYHTVPYYKEALDRARVKPEDIRSKDDLYKIPILTRENIRNNLGRLISSKYNKEELVSGHTSGTTGSPLQFYWDINTCVYTNAVDWRQKQWAGIKYRDKIAFLLGRTVVPVRQTKPPFWRMNYLHNQLWLSAFHMTDDNLKYYIQKLDEFRPQAIEGYPSTLYILARYMLSRGCTMPVKAVLTSSETLYEWQKKTIEQAFQCNIFDYFGMAERVLFATECAEHSGHHLNFEYGITEILDEDGNPVSSGKMGYLVGTSLQNYGMPFLRYRTTDVSAIKVSKCSCGRAMPLIESVTTKAEDIIVTPEGKMISPSALTHPFKSIHNIEKSQIVQDDIGSIVIRIVTKPGYTDSDTRELLHGLRERLGTKMEINVEFVDDIPRTAAGKYRWVISRVSLPI